MKLLLLLTTVVITLIMTILLITVHTFHKTAHSVGKVFQQIVVQVIGFKPSLKRFLLHDSNYSEQNRCWPCDETGSDFLTCDTRDSYYRCLVWRGRWPSTGDTDTNNTLVPCRVVGATMLGGREDSSSIIVFFNKAADSEH